MLGVVDTGVDGWGADSGVRVAENAPRRAAPRRSLARLLAYSLARSRSRVSRISGRAGESVRGEARQLPHVMILPQVSDDVPRYYHYHPVVNRTTAENREYTLKW